MTARYPCPICGDDFYPILSAHMREWHDITFLLWSHGRRPVCVCGRVFKELEGEKGLYQHFSDHGKDCIIVRAMQ